MALRFARNRSVDGVRENGVVARSAQRRAQVGRVVLAEAHVERSGAGQPDAVAAFAKIMSQRRDEAEAAAGLCDANIARWSTGAVIAFFQGKVFRKLRAHQ